jgi:hypothetical protein
MAEEVLMLKQCKSNKSPNQRRRLHAMESWKSGLALGPPSLPAGEEMILMNGFSQGDINICKASGYVSSNTEVSLHITSMLTKIPRSRGLYA